MVIADETVQHTRVEVIRGRTYELSERGQETLPMWARSLLEDAYSCSLNGVNFNLNHNTLTVAHVSGSNVHIIWEVIADRELDFLDKLETAIHSEPQTGAGETRVSIKTSVINYGSNDSFEMLVRITN